MKKFGNLPSIITLLAGFVTSVIMIISEYPITSFLWILITVMAAFFVAGVLIRMLLSRVLKENEPKEKGDSKDGEEELEDGSNDRNVSMKAKDD